MEYNAAHARYNALNQKRHHRQALRAITIVAIAIIALALLTTPHAPQCIDQGIPIDCTLLTNLGN